MAQSSAVRLAFDGRQYPALKFTGTEAISKPFSFEITVINSPEFETPAMRGASAGIRLQDKQGNVREVHGYIAAIRESIEELSLFIEPLLAFGQWSSNTRLFLGKTRREIITQVLQELGYRKDQIHWQQCATEENLIQKHGGAYLNKIKQQNREATEGSRHLQAAKQQLWRATKTFSQSSDGWQRWQAKQGGFTVRCEGAATLKSNGSQIHKISDGSYQVQASGPIRIEGKGEGDLVLMGGNGKGGVKIDKDGNIKVWGVQVTIKGRGAVTFNGDVEYDPGAGNEPKEAISVTPEEIPEIEALNLDGREPVEGSPHTYERETNHYDDTAEEFAEIVVKTRSNQILANQKVVLCHADGRETLLVTDDQGLILVQKPHLKDATLRVLGRRMEKR